MEMKELPMAARIVYLSWSATEIAGGIKIAFPHIKALQEAGIDAVIAAPGAETPAWFETIASIIDVSQAVAGDDILVFPKNHYGMLQAFMLQHY